MSIEGDGRRVQTPVGRRAFAALTGFVVLVRPEGPAPGARLLTPATFRVALVAPGVPGPGERLVERVVTPWNEPCGVVLSKPAVPNGGRERNVP